MEIWRVRDSEIWSSRYSQVEKFRCRFRDSEIWSSAAHLELSSALLLVVGPLSTDPEGRKFPGRDADPEGPSFRRKESGNAK